MATASREMTDNPIVYRIMGLIEEHRIRSYGLSQHIFRNHIEVEV